MNMPDSGRNQEPSLEEIRRSDSFIDALAGGLPADSADQDDAALAALLGNWRDENRWPPDAGLISEPQAIAALDAGLAEQSTGFKREKRTPGPTPVQRNRRGLSVVGAAAAAMLAIGGFGAVVSGAGPGDSLYGLRTMLFGTPKQVRDDQVALAARTEMQQVQQLISQGEWQQAEQKLVAVSSQVAGIGDEQQKQQLLDQFNDLSAKVVERNPEATAAPGITYTVPPSATELVPAAVTPSSSAASPSATVGTASTTPTSATPTSASTSAATTDSASAVTTSAAATSVPSTSAASSTAASTSATQQTQASSTTTSAKPSTSSASSSASSSVTSAATTSAPAAAATTTPATTAGATSATGVTTTSAPAAAASSTAASSVSATAPATTTSVPAAAGGARAGGGAAPAQTATTAPAPAAATPAAPAVTPTTTTVVIPLPATAG